MINYPKLIVYSLILVFFFQTLELKTSDVSIRHESVNNKVIDLGIAYKGNDFRDSIFTNFIINNKSDVNYIMRRGFPNGNAIYQVATGDLSHIQFSDQGNNYPKSIPANSESNLRIQYLYSSAPLIESNLNQCFLQISITDPIDDNKVVAKDTFRIIARWTNKYIGLYEDKIEFDSVYINPIAPVSKSLNIKNVYLKNLNIIGSKSEYLTPLIGDGEFEIDNLELPINLPSKSPLKIGLRYLPKDTITDIMNLEYYFNPFENDGDFVTVDTIKTQISGTGVIQKIDLINILTNQSLNTNTEYPIIDLGERKLGAIDTVKFILKNNGNFEYKVLNEQIISADKNKYIIDDSHIKNSVYNKLESDTVQLIIESQSRGVIDSEYIFRTDLIERGIKGATPKNSIYKVKLSGEVLAPMASIALDSLKFDDVIFSPNCPNYINKEIRIKNIGNAPLEILDIRLINADDFDYNISRSTIPSLEEAIINIKFEPQKEGEIFGALYIVTNEKMGNDTLRLYLNGYGIPTARMELKIEDIDAKPGSAIKVPILVESAKIKNIKGYSDLIEYDRTLLEFNEVIYQNTASYPPNIGNVVKISDGLLEININGFNNNNFTESDTLLILVFNTFLGNKDQTYINFGIPRFSTDNCDDILDLEIKSGLFRLDSICGLDYKVYESNGNIFDFEGVYPNPAFSETNILFSLPFRSSINLKLIDRFGREVRNIKDIEFPGGKYSFKLDLRNIAPGPYIINFTSGIYNKSKKIIISK